MSNIHQLRYGERIKLFNSNSEFGKIDICVKLSSDFFDINASIDYALICKKMDGNINILSYVGNNCEQSFITDRSCECMGSSWDDDDFRISLDFENCPINEIDKIAFVTNILWGSEMKMHYGLISNGILRIYNHNTKSYVLEQKIDFSNHKRKNGLVWTIIYFHKGEWKIRSQENSFISKDLGELITQTKINSL